MRVEGLTSVAEQEESFDKPGCQADVLKPIYGNVIGMHIPAPGRQGFIFCEGLAEGQDLGLSAVVRSVRANDLQSLPGAANHLHHMTL